MKRENTQNFHQNNSLNKDSYMNTLRQNIEEYLHSHRCTIKELAEAADIPFATLNNLLYCKTHKDCRLGTVINLSKTMNFTLDELLGNNSLSEDLQLVSALRTLPKRSKYMVKWFLDYQITLSETYDFHRQRIVDVMYPALRNTGCLAPTNDFRPLDISNHPMSTKTKVFMGLYISCDYYMPFYCPYDILLIANDRPAKPDEICIIMHYGHLHLAKRREIYQNGTTITQFISLRDGLVRTTDDKIDMLLGYVADVYHDLK